MEAVPLLVVTLAALSCAAGMGLFRRCARISSLGRLAWTVPVLGCTAKPTKISGHNTQ